MNTKSSFWKFSLAFSLATLVGIATLATSCGHPGTSGQAAPCSGGAGTELCPCETGNVCQSGLVCATDKNECVSLTGGGGTGSAGTSGGGATTGAAGTNGSSGIAGTTGSAGTNGSSGIAGTTGSAGTTGAAGTTGSTGAAGTNGSSGSNLITNGDFSMGTTDWSVPSGSPTSSGVTNNKFCVTFGGSSGTVVIGWGSASIYADLLASTNYTLSYEASTSSPISMFQVHLGPTTSSVTPFPVDESYDDTPGTSLTPFSHSFSLNSGEPIAGVAFEIAASTGTPTVCVGNLSITQN